MPYPGVSVEVENGNLLRAITVTDGLGAIVATAATAGNIGKVQQVFSLPDAEQKGYTATAEPFLHTLIEQFYTEMGGNQQLYIMGVAETMTMADVVNSTNADGLVKLLTATNGAVNIIALARKPVDGYDGGTDFLDADVQATVTASLPLCKAWQNKNRPFRLFIEGRVVNEDVENTFIPNEAGNGFTGVVLGSTANDGSAAVALALARACLYPAHIKLGSGQNGALSVNQLYVGTKPIEERLDMEILHDMGFITFHNRPGAAGYYFGRDNMCESGDFRILVHGRVIDKTQRIAASAYLPYVEDYIRVNADGTINATDAKHLEDVLKSAILAGMEGQISAAEVVIDLNQAIIESSTLQVSARILPLGYLTWINVTLGLTAQLTTT